jgi:hypothetical protein
VKIQKETSIRDISGQIKDFSVEQNYPNPFNPLTVINYQLPVFSHVTLKLYNLIGREILTLVDEEKTAGRYQVMFDGNNISSGIYYYIFQSGNYSQMKKMIFLK